MKRVINFFICFLFCMFFVHSAQAEKTAVSDDSVRAVEIKEEVNCCPPFVVGNFIVLFIGNWGIEPGYYVELGYNEAEVKALRREGNKAIVLSRKIRVISFLVRPKKGGRYVIDFINEGTKTIVNIVNLTNPVIAHDKVKVSFEDVPRSNFPSNDIRKLFGAAITFSLLDYVNTFFSKKNV